MSPQPHVANGRVEPLWFLGTLARIKLDGEQTGGRFALWEAEVPRGAAPPLHSHPQDETFYVLEGEVTVWVEDEPRLCRPGAATFALAVLLEDVTESVESVDATPNTFVSTIPCRISSVPLRPSAK